MLHKMENYDKARRLNNALRQEVANLNADGKTSLAIQLSELIRDLSFESRVRLHDILAECETRDEAIQVLDDPR